MATALTRCDCAQLGKAAAQVAATAYPPPTRTPVPPPRHRGRFMRKARTGSETKKL
jgi:hypothetical protein